MNFGERSKIKSKERIAKFLETEHTGRIATIDKNGFPFVAPMNFVYDNDAIYIHGFPRGEKYDNIKLNSKCGFEVDKELAFLPSYFFEPPTDASLTDTLYISVVIKGYAELVTDNAEKAKILNKLIAKYQIEGGYESLRPDMATIRGVNLMKIKPEIITGKYKLGKYWNPKDKLRITTRIMERAIKNPKRTLELLNVAGLNKLDDKTTKELAWIHSSEIVRMMGFQNNVKYPDISLSSTEEVDW
ncbi:MAG: pyridoxamine 5'-phosphate oxidase family protein [Thaumarchaeota archaeon]|nr:pyridoxamine 5'-phosphate oxidase family protein [Candidatus Nitrosotalea sp.]MDE1872022.1 pyridoxamine 5'-phosphate oxidase family protein [Nitrososphaerota archaeon]